MNRSQDKLSEALHELAADAPQGAPPELGVRMNNAFDRHHARRRRNRMALVVGLAACLLISFGWLQVKSSRSNVRPAVAQAPAAPPSPIAAAQNTGEAIAGQGGRTRAVSTVRPKQVNRAHRAAREEAPPEIASDDFVALPTFNPSIPIGQSRMVRMEMPGTALQLIGYPVDEQLLDRRVTTDLLVGQDGVPYAIRFVQTGSTR